MGRKRFRGEGGEFMKGRGLGRGDGGDGKGIEKSASSAASVWRSRGRGREKLSRSWRLEAKAQSKQWGKIERRTEWYLLDWQKGGL